LEQEPDVKACASASAAIRAYFATQTARGSLFALDVAADEDAQRLAEIVVRMVSSGLDQIRVADMQRERAAADERARLSRDLHDDLLQTLGGMALHTQSARLIMRTDERAADERPHMVVEHLAEGQRSLREFVDELRPQLRSRHEPLKERLERLARMVASQWNVQVRVETDAAIDAIGGHLRDEVLALIAEGLSNAGRHAGAARIVATVRLEDGSVRIDVKDDGRGFPFRGRYDHSQLVANEQAPWSLKERITALGGALAIESSPAGSHVELCVPYERTRRL
jgi:signal transduction histidine kinase